jgi:hypothetical protein
VPKAQRNYGCLKASRESAKGSVVNRIYKKKMMDGRRSVDKNPLGMEIVKEEEEENLE